MTQRNFDFFANTGGIHQPTGLQAQKQTEAEDIVNLHMTSAGTWTSKNVGYQVLTSTPFNSGAAITGLYRFIDGDNQEHLMVGSGDSLYAWQRAGDVRTPIGSGFTPNQRFHFATFQNWLIACNGTEPPKMWDGTGSLQNLTGWPPSIAGVSPGYPSIVETFANRLIFAGDVQNPSMLYLSELENPINFTPTSGNPASAGAIQVAPGDGDRITALKSFYLPLTNENVLIIFKERAIYLLTGHDATTFELQKVTENLGAVSAQSVVMVGSDIMFLSAQGVATLSTATLQGNLAATSLSAPILPRIQALNTSALPGSFAMVLPPRQEVWWFVPTGSETRNTDVLIYSLVGASPVWFRRTGIQATCGAWVADHLLTGNGSGQIQQQMTGNSYGATPIAWTYRTPFYLLGNSRQRKRIREVGLYLTELATSSLTVKGAWDFKRSEALRTSRTVTVRLSQGSSLYGSSVYGQARYHEAGIYTKKLIFPGSGQSFQLEFTGSQTTQPVEIQGWRITTIEGGLVP